MTKLSLRQIANELEISPAYLSYMVNGKRPCRKDLYQRYMGVVNTFVNGESDENVTKAIKRPPQEMASVVYSVPRFDGGSARETNPPTPLVTRHNGFEAVYWPDKA